MTPLASIVKFSASSPDKEYDIRLSRPSWSLADTVINADPNKEMMSLTNLNQRLNKQEQTTQWIISKGKLMVFTTQYIDIHYHI